MSTTAARVRELVARLPATEEGAHHGHPDFRVQKKIFASLSEAEDRVALRLSQHEARELSISQPAVFRLVSDREPYSWLSAPLDAIEDKLLGDLLEEAWRLRAPENLVAAYDSSEN